MGKGSNYVNNNKGVFLQGSKKTPETMPMCQYGGGCSRPSCIYRHPASNGPIKQSKEPCMAYLAGLCAFDSKGCRKRHPPNHEMERLIAKYKKTRCRFGDECKTKGCLYMHPSDVVEERISQSNIAWDNQCQFVPPTVITNTMQQQQQQQQPAVHHSMQSPTTTSQAFYQQYTMPQQQHQQSHLYTRSLPSTNVLPQSFVPQQQRFVPSPSANAFVPKASSQEFVPGQYK